MPTRFANSMFWIILLVLLMALTGLALFLTGHPEAARLLDDFGPLVVFGTALVGLTLSPERTYRLVSSDWLVDRLTRRRPPKPEE